MPAPCEFRATAAALRKELNMDKVTAAAIALLVKGRQNVDGGRFDALRYCVAGSVVEDVSALTRALPAQFFVDNDDLAAFLEDGDVAHDDKLWMCVLMGQTQNDRDKTLLEVFELYTPKVRLQGFIIGNMITVPMASYDIKAHRARDLGAFMLLSVDDDKTARSHFECVDEPARVPPPMFHDNDGNACPFSAFDALLQLGAVPHSSGAVAVTDGRLFHGILRAVWTSEDTETQAGIMQATLYFMLQDDAARTALVSALEATAEAAFGADSDLPDPGALATATDVLRVAYPEGDLTAFFTMAVNLAATLQLVFRIELTNVLDALPADKRLRVAGYYEPKTRLTHPTMRVTLGELQ